MFNYLDDKTPPTSSEQMINSVIDAGLKRKTRRRMTKAVAVCVVILMAVTVSSLIYFNRNDDKKNENIKVAGSGLNISSVQVIPEDYRPRAGKYLLVTQEFKDMQEYDVYVKNGHCFGMGSGPEWNPGDEKINISIAQTGYRRYWMPSLGKKTIAIDYHRESKLSTEEDRKKVDSFCPGDIDKFIRNDTVRFAQPVNKVIADYAEFLAEYNQEQKEMTKDPDSFFSSALEDKDIRILQYLFPLQGIKAPVIPFETRRKLLGEIEKFPGVTKSEKNIGGRDVIQYSTEDLDSDSGYVYRKNYIVDKKPCNIFLVKFQIQRKFQNLTKVKM